MFYLRYLVCMNSLNEKEIYIRISDCDNIRLTEQELNTIVYFIHNQLPINLFLKSARQLNIEHGEIKVDSRKTFTLYKSDFINAFDCLKTGLVLPYNEKTIQLNGANYEINKKYLLLERV